MSISITPHTFNMRTYSITTRSLPSNVVLFFFPVTQLITPKRLFIPYFCNINTFITPTFCNSTG